MDPEHSKPIFCRLRWHAWLVMALLPLILAAAAAAIILLAPLAVRDVLAGKVQKGIVTLVITAAFAYFLLWLIWKRSPLWHIPVWVRIDETRIAFKTIFHQQKQYSLSQVSRVKLLELTGVELTFDDGATLLLGYLDLTHVKDLLSFLLQTRPDLRPEQEP